MSAQYKVMCGYECCISAKCVHSSLISWRHRYLKKLKYQSKKIKAEDLVKKHITDMKHTKIQWCHIDVIFIPKHMIWYKLQCAHILSLIMHFHTINVYCGSVLTFRVSIFLRHNTINTVSHLSHYWTLYCSW